LICLIFVLVDVTSAKKTFTLPGDKKWPTQYDVRRLSKRLTGTLVELNDENYQTPHTYNQRTGPPKPAFIVTPVTTRDISESLHFCRHHVIRVAVISTGHHQDVRNSVDNALLLNMSNFNKKEVDIASKTLTVGPGLDFATIHAFVYSETNGTLVSMSAADVSVGPTGWVLGGGHGRLTRLHGLGVDALISVKLVLADGQTTTASSTHNSDLFRALRGGAGSAFGVIYSLTFQLYKDPGPMSFFIGYYYPTPDVANVFQAYMAAAPDYVGAYYILSINTTYYTPYIELAAHCFGSNDACDTALNGLYSIPDCYLTGPIDCQVLNAYPSYGDYLMDSLNTGDIGGLFSFYLVNTALNFKTPGQLAAVNQWVGSFNFIEWPAATIGCSGNAILGGVSSKLDPYGTKTAVAPALRNAIMTITCYVGYAAGTSRQDLVDKMDIWANTTLKPLGVNHFVYWNEPQHNFVSNKDWQTSYWGSVAAYEKLRAVKRRYDPFNVLTCYQCVGWEDIENVDPAVCPAECSCSNALNDNTCVNEGATTIGDDNSTLIFDGFSSAGL